MHILLFSLLMAAKALHFEDDFDISWSDWLKEWGNVKLGAGFMIWPKNFFVSFVENVTRTQLSRMKEILTDENWLSIEKCILQNWVAMTEGRQNFFYCYLTPVGQDLVIRSDVYGHNCVLREYDAEAYWQLEDCGCLL